MHEDLIEGEEAGEGLRGIYISPYFPLDTVLRMSKAVIAKTGFTSTTTAYEQGGSSSKSNLMELASVVLHGAAIDKYNRWLQDEGEIVLDRTHHLCIVPRISVSNPKNSYDCFK